MENGSFSSNNVNSNVHGGVYFITVVGAAVYFLQSAATVWEGVLGILKACVWPAFAVYKLMELLSL